MNQIFEDYLSKVCSQIQSQDAREMVHMELADHLDSFYRQAVGEGKSQDEAVREALETMEDDPLELGRLMDEAYSEDGQNLLFT